MTKKQLLLRRILFSCLHLLIVALITLYCYSITHFEAVPGFVFAVLILPIALLVIIWKLVQTVTIFMFIHKSADGNFSSYKEAKKALGEKEKKQLNRVRFTVAILCVLLGVWVGGSSLYLSGGRGEEIASALQINKVGNYNMPQANATISHEMSAFPASAYEKMSSYITYTLLNAETGERAEERVHCSLVVLENAPSWYVNLCYREHVEDLQYAQRTFGSNSNVQILEIDGLQGYYYVREDQSLMLIVVKTRNEMIYYNVGYNYENDSYKLDTQKIIDIVLESLV